MGLEKGLEGKRVVGEINMGCGRCPHCLKGMQNHCPNRSVLGILNKDGVFADYVTLPMKNLHVIPDSVTDGEAVFVGTLALKMRSIDVRPLISKTFPLSEGIEAFRYASEKGVLKVLLKA
jgi:threonine dehydrogenase-like Zn-dependent dehydrogenase